MSSKINYKLQFLLILISFSIAIFLVGVSTVDIVKSLLLTQKVPAESIHLTIVETKSQNYKIEAVYTYLVNNKHFEKTEVISNVEFNNPYQAKKVIDSAEGNWVVWYQKNHHDRASLQKEVSIKKIVHALLSVGVFIYFLFTGEIQLEQRFRRLLKRAT